MIVERWTWKVKLGCRAEVIELAKTAIAEAGLTPRICSFIFGPYDIVSSDLEFESEEDRQKWWAGLDWSQPGLAEWRKKEPELLVSGTSHELLHVH
jgi:hypothetical protein